jgi:dipeptidyl aminopeptidase/acylaminoacyl peptidase
MSYARLAVCSVLFAGCGAASVLDKRDAGGAAGPGGAPVNPGQAPPGNNQGAGSGGAGGAAPMPPPPEMEEKRTFETPSAGARYVYVANPRRDTVAVIDSTTLAIRSVNAGDTPTYLRTIPGKDVALVINVGSHDVTVLRTDASGTRSSTVPVINGANALDISPDGRHVIAWYDTPTGPAARPASFQDVSLITLGDKDESVALTVGFRPREVDFSSDGSAAFVITEDGVSIIRFADVRGPTVLPLVPAGDLKMAAAPADVSVTPDGKFAISRWEGMSQIQIVDLATRAITALDLGSAVTDLDVSPAGDFALAVLREAGKVVRLTIPGGFTSEAERRTVTLTGESVGSAALSPDGKTAVLYTTTGVERLVLLDLITQVPRPVRLKKGVRAVALSPDNHTALIVHTKEQGDPAQPGIDVEQMIDRSYGYSVVDLTSGFAKLQLTPAPVGDLAITPDATRAFVLLRNDAASIRVAQRINLASFIVDDFPLGSPPVAVAALSDSKRIFVSQAHPEGRISFIQWETGAVESVTGFELNGRIVQ